MLAVLLWVSLSADNPKDRIQAIPTIYKIVLDIKKEEQEKAKK